MWNIKLINKKRNTVFGIRKKLIEYSDIGKLSLYDIPKNRQLLLYTNVHLWGTTVTVGIPNSRYVVLSAKDLGLLGTYLLAMSEKFTEYQFFKNEVKNGI